jgi:mannose-1-phosphate guanylyltransferase / mannose-6-phosphate isomerase
MSGGAGARLWPASTDKKPKQFLPLCGEIALLEATLRRVCASTADFDFLPPIVLGSEPHRELILSSCADAGVQLNALVLEPVSRNTAATAAVAAAVAKEISDDAMVLLLPADHIVSDVAAFHEAIAAAAAFARDHIVTFGIQPTRPATEYGYIRSGAQLGQRVYKIDRFHEKPPLETARAFLAEGGFTWNAGMFLFVPELLLREFSNNPDIRDNALAALASARRNDTEICLDATLFAATRALPLDIAVMEQTALGAVRPCAIGWADIGSWDEVWRNSAKDPNGNASSGHVHLDDVANCLVIGDGVRVCVAGARDLIVIATQDATLVAPMSRAQDVKKLREPLT